VFASHGAYATRPEEDIEAEMKSHRLARVREVIREVAAETILFGLKDPRVKGVTVTRAEVSGDLQHAKVFVSIMGTASEQALCMHGLTHAAGYIQSKLADRMQTRFIPSVRFEIDKGVKNSIEVSRLIAEALAESKPAAPEQGPAGDSDEAHRADAADGSAGDGST
jgi:ribosome-binding factor A